LPWLVVIAALMVSIGGVIAKESREPYLWLYIDDLLHPKPAPQVLPLPGGLWGRLYADTRPHTGKVARLQKGMALGLGDSELIEEGFGFGLPMAEAGGQAYMARTATVEQVSRWTWVKRYTLDTIDTSSGFLRRKYVPVTPIGTVVVTYTVQGGGLDVEVDLAGLIVDWDRAYVMNEQGAGAFTRYLEPGKAPVDLPGDGQAQWQRTAASRSCLATASVYRGELPEPVMYCVETEPGLTKYYGRERYNQYYWLGMYGLSWAGIDIEVPAGMPRLHYRIELGLSR